MEVSYDNKKNNLADLQKHYLKRPRHEGRGRFGKAAYEKITMRHLSVKIKTSLFEPLTGKDIRMIREQARLSQAVFARYLNLTVGYVSQLERGSKRPIARHLCC